MNALYWTRSSTAEPGWARGRATGESYPGKRLHRSKHGFGNSAAFADDCMPWVRLPSTASGANANDTWHASQRLYAVLASRLGTRGSQVAAAIAAATCDPRSRPRPHERQPLARRFAASLAIRGSRTPLTCRRNRIGRTKPLNWYSLAATDLCYK